MSGRYIHGCAILLYGHDNTHGQHNTHKCTHAIELTFEPIGIPSGQ